MQEIAADFPSLSHRYVVGIHELYGQVSAGMHERSMCRPGQHRSHCILTQVYIATGAAPCKSQLRGKQHDLVRAAVAMADSFWGQKCCC